MIKNLNIIAKAESERISALPAFIREDYSKFVSFMSAYYKWSATFGADLGFEVLKGTNDIDLVVSDLLPKYRASYAANFPADAKTDFRFFAKHLKEFYQWKGTDEGNRIFYRAVFGADVEKIEPSKQVLRSSGATWGKKEWVYFSVKGEVSAVAGEVFKNPANASFVVDEVFNLGGGTILATVEQKEGNMTLGLDWTNEDGTLTLSHLSQHEIVSFSGDTRRFTAGDTFTAGGLTFKVDAIHQGRIESATITNGGSGYEVDDEINGNGVAGGGGFKAIVTSVGPAGEVQGIKVTRRGFGFNTDEVVFSTNGKGTGVELAPVFDAEFRRVKHLSIVRNGRFAAPSVSHDGLTINLKESFSHKEHAWEVEADMPSTPTAYIHDGDYYQSFSYELVSSVDATSHKEDMKRLLHVAGMKMFLGTTIHGVKKTSP